jgi:hypothetical protein
LSYLLSNLDTIGHSEVCHSIQDRAFEHQLFELIINLASLQPIAEDRLEAEDLSLRHAPAMIVALSLPLFGFWRKFLRAGRLSLFSTSPYTAITAFHTCRIMAPGLVISDVSNCPFLILFANSIPLKVTSAFPNVLNHSIG